MSFGAVVLFIYKLYNDYCIVDLLGLYVQWLYDINSPVSLGHVKKTLKYIREGEGYGT